MPKYYCNYCNFRTIRIKKYNDHLLYNHRSDEKKIILTLSSCFYIIKKNKYNLDKYKYWISNMLDNINNFNIVIYTNEESKYIFDNYKNNKKIKIIIKEYDDFYNYKYKDNWIENQKKNKSLNFIDWKVQLIWAEKISFVKNTIDNLYFDTEYYAWCDIGYFRWENSLPAYEVRKWPNNYKLNNINKNLIYYTDTKKLTQKQKEFQKNKIKCTNNLGIRIKPIKDSFIAGGFFLINKTNINWWFDTFYKKIKFYFDNNFLIKDDQIIINDCYYSNPDKFHLIKEKFKTYQSGFAFSTYLL